MAEIGRVQSTVSMLSRLSMRAVFCLFLSCNTFMPGPRACVSGWTGRLAALGASANVHKLGGVWHFLDGWFCSSTDRAAEACSDSVCVEMRGILGAVFLAIFGGLGSVREEELGLQARWVVLPQSPPPHV